MTHLLDRRQVLGAGAVALTAAMTGRPLSAEDGAAENAESPDGKMGVALCGLGGFSRESIAPEFAFAKNVRFAGAITGDPEKGRQWAEKYGFATENIFGYDEMDRLADCDDIDIVHVVTPNALHAEHTIAAARAGKHVMCEKPMATSVEQCDAMIAAAEDAGVRLGVNYRLQFEPHHLEATKRLADGAAGDLSVGNYEFSWRYAKLLGIPSVAKTMKKWLLDPKLAGGGAMFDTGVYPVQAACYLTGQEPVAVRGMPSTRHQDLFPEGVEETMSFELLFENGFQALCRASYSTNHGQCTTLGSNGTVEVVAGDGGSVFGQSQRAGFNPKTLLVNGNTVELENTYQLAVLLDQFATAIRSSTPFIADGAMGRRDIKIVEAVYQSARNGGQLVPVTA